MTGAPTELVDALVRCQAVRFGDFVLKSGQKSSYYVDIKRASTDPRVLRLVGTMLAERAKGADMVAGVELGAIPLAAATSLAGEIPFLMVRKKPKEHGTGSRIEGVFQRGARVVLVEDVTTTGGSSVEAVEALRAEGLEVLRVVAVVDRGTETAKAFERIGVPFESLVDAKRLMEARK